MTRVKTLAIVDFKNKLLLLIIPMDGFINCLLIKQTLTRISWQSVEYFVELFKLSILFTTVSIGNGCSVREADLTQLTNDQT